MFDPQEQDAILNRIDDVIYELRCLPVEDVSYFLVKNEPTLAKSLFDSLSINITEQIRT